MTHKRHQIEENAVVAELAPITAWTFQAEVAIPPDIAPVLVQGEQPIAAYKTFRDTAVFTTKRLIVRDAQGLTGKKVEIYSLPYSAINMWSSENAGTFDLNSEMELWTRSGHIKVNLGKGVDVRRLDHLISSAVLGVIH
ncbi:PH domain-containing protein [Aestuariimicrobium ganziense]|uniref:PH domain-containing protein n=1 Tax=Aestuariimicrobium ganziense TaxID=2773677 RepID=UPI001A9B580D|nr:PH domain-containing protein [Aestuariimicrobium ganziense]